MRLSNYFFYSSKDAPSSADIVSHSLLIQAGFITPSASGIYSWMPMGLKVLNKISNIIREEHSRYGVIELLMPTIQPSYLWNESGRYDSYGKELLRFKDRHEQELLYGPTNEEMITDIFKRYVKSYRELPKILHHIQWKFRDEIRPRFGVMRGREFLMEDAYSFDCTAADAENSYNKMFELYLQIFKRIGVRPIVVQASSGAIGGDMNHEFHILANTGESTLYYDKKMLECSLDNIDNFKKLYAVAEEKYSKDSGNEQNLISSKGIEIGHIFYFGTKYTKSMDCKVANSNGDIIYPFMGSYGIGISRLVGAICESCHDTNGMVWPKSITPFEVIILNVSSHSEETALESESLYNNLLALGIDVLYDDRNISAGNKFNDADLIGIPIHIILGNNYINNKSYSIKIRHNSNKITMSSQDEIKKFILEYYQK